MNTLITIGVLLIICHVTVAKKTEAASVFFYSAQESNCQKAGLQCKDCMSIEYCSSDLQPLFSVKCEDQNRLLPYCDSTTNTCTSVKPEACEDSDNDFFCPGVGFYPDPVDCKKYYYCYENRKSQAFECPLLTNYDQKVQSCRRGAICRSYSPTKGLCKKKLNKFVTYAPSRDLYVLCLPTNPILLQCPNKGDVFDDTDGSCKFECTADGFFPDVTNPRKFHSCIKIGTKFIHTEMECLYGTEFVPMGEGKGACVFTTTVAPTTTEEITTTKQEEETTTAKHEEETTTAKHEEETTTAKQEEETTTAKHEEETTTTKQEEEVTTAKHEEEITTTEGTDKPLPTTRLPGNEEGSEDNVVGNNAPTADEESVASNDDEEASAPSNNESNPDDSVPSNDDQDEEENENEASLPANNEPSVEEDSSPNGDAETNENDDEETAPSNNDEEDNGAVDEIVAEIVENIEAQAVDGTNENSEIPCADDETANNADDDNQNTVEDRK